MNDLFIGLLAALVTTNPPAASDQLVKQTNGVTVSASEEIDPVQKEYEKILVEDDAAQAEVDRWIRENTEFAKKGAAISSDTLNARIHARFAPVKKSYEDFLKRHPDHVKMRLAYGSFLNDTGEEEDAFAQYDKARELDPKNATAWNQAANYYGHHGPVSKSFEYYGKAIELAPRQPIYYQNLAMVVAFFRKDAMDYYKLDEQQVYDKALAIYAEAMKLDSNNFDLAHDIAQTYYGIRPPRVDESLKAWSNALNIATSDIEKEGVYVHLARIEVSADRLADARQHLRLVTNVFYKDLRARIARNLSDKEHPVVSTNSVPTVILTNFPAADKTLVH